MRQSSIATEYARARWTLNAEGVAEGLTFDAQVVQMAFLASSTAEPDTGDWVAATWLTAAGTSRTCGVLVGPGALVLAEGTWYVWTRLTDTPEIIPRKVGTLVIT